MIHYYNHLLLTMSEIKHHKTLLIHALSGCMFHCFKCINYEELILKKQEEYYRISELMKLMERQKDLFDTVVFSGGEFLLYSIEDLIHDLRMIKEDFSQPIIIYTSGLFVEKMQILLDLELVDGFHIDMKLPYHLLTEDDQELMALTFGKTMIMSDINSMMQGIELAVKTDQGLNQIRSVRYPFLDASAFVACEDYIKGLNHLYNKSVIYETHGFIEGD